jgi:ABC-type xylose transport system permease subunit
MGILIFIGLFGLLGWIAFCTIRAFRREHVGTAWWIFLCSLLLVGIATGIWAGFMLEYHVSPTVRFAGFPFPMAIFQLESGTWVDYVHETFIMICIGVADVMLVTLCSVIPVAAAFYVYRFLHKQRLDART